MSLVCPRANQYSSKLHSPRWTRVFPLHSTSLQACINKSSPHSCTRTFPHSCCSPTPCTFVIPTPRELELTSPHLTHTHPAAIPATLSHRAHAHAITAVGDRCTSTLYYAYTRDYPPHQPHLPPPYPICCRRGLRRPGAACGARGSCCFRSPRPLLRIAPALTYSLLLFIS